MPKILIIIVTWNKKQDVLSLLRSVTDMDYPPEDMDVLVIDNASQDGTPKAVSKAYPQVRLIRNAENLGGSGGFNTGLQWAFDQPMGQYDYLWLLDNDVRVHGRALTELVALLEEKADIGVAGSTMMQLDHPWRINEMGAFLDRRTGRLRLNRHLEPIAPWKGCAVESLRSEKTDLCNHLKDWEPFSDVDYVAATSLLVRTEVAKAAGLWKDYFIHFDDVEWCLRIAKMGHRIVASGTSLIWHSSSSAKVPSQMLYYDNRNVLDLLRTHHADNMAIRRIIRRIRLKAIYYALTGRGFISCLHREAIKDFLMHRLGKRVFCHHQGVPPQTLPRLDEMVNILKEWMGSET